MDLIIKIIDTNLNISKHKPSLIPLISLVFPIPCVVSRPLSFCSLTPGVVPRDAVVPGTKRQQGNSLTVHFVLRFMAGHTEVIIRYCKLTMFHGLPTNMI